MFISQINRVFYNVIVGQYGVIIIKYATANYDNNFNRCKDIKAGAERIVQNHIS